jgi:serine protease DegQ
MVMEQILTTGQVTRGYIGVETQVLSPELAESFGLPAGQPQGVVVAGVLQNGPADKAGLKPGDVLLAINDKALQTPSDMRNTIAVLKPEQTAQLKVLRAGAEKKLEVVVGTRPKRQQQ